MCTGGQTATTLGAHGLRGHDGRLSVTMGKMIGLSADMTGDIGGQQQPCMPATDMAVRRGGWVHAGPGFVLLQQQRDAAGSAHIMHLIHLHALIVPHQVRH